MILLAARRLASRQIARPSPSSEATAKRHLANAYPEAGARSRTGAAHKALAEGWISVEDATGGPSTQIPRLVAGWGEREGE